MQTLTQNPNKIQTGTLTLKYKDFWGHQVIIQLRPAGTDWVVVAAWTETIPGTPQPTSYECHSG